MSIESPFIDVLRQHVDAVDRPSRDRFSVERPSNALAPLPPKPELETKPAMKTLVGARASSEIENIVTTADRLFRFAQHDESKQADPATKEALRYRSALMPGCGSWQRSL